ncbi:MAG: IS3 family transposase [Myxococcota bacterium]
MKSSHLLCEGEAVRFAFIATASEQHEVSVLCRMLGVSRSGFYAWAHRPRSKRQSEDDRLKLLIRAIYRRSRGTYGAPRIHAELVASGERVGRKRVARLMRGEGLEGRSPRRRGVRTTMAPAGLTGTNVLDRAFTVDGPNVAWVADTTYIHTEAGWAFLTAILDLFSRRVVGWAVSAQLSTQLARQALRQAVTLRGARPGLIFHSDRGGEFTSNAFVGDLEQIGAIQSLSRPGECYDNVPMESFFGTLKDELRSPAGIMRPVRVKLRHSPSRDETRPHASLAPVIAISDLRLVARICAFDETARGVIQPQMISGLSKLLQSCFTADEVRIFLGTHYPDLAATLEYKSRREAAFAAAQGLMSFGLVGPDLFDRLRKERSGRSADISQIERMLAQVDDAATGDVSVDGQPSKPRWNSIGWAGAASALLTGLVIGWATLLTGAPNQPKMTDDEVKELMQHLIDIEEGQGSFIYYLKSACIDFDEEEDGYVLLRSPAQEKIVGDGWYREVDDLRSLIAQLKARIDSARGHGRELAKLYRSMARRHAVLTEIIKHADEALSKDRIRELHQRYVSARRLGAEFCYQQYGEEACDRFSHILRSSE